MKPRRAVSKGAVLLVAALLGTGLSACEPNQLGAAAIIDDQRITVTEVQGYLDTVREQREQFGLPEDVGPDAARLEVERRVLDMVFDRAAAAMGIRVTPAEVEATRAAEERSDAEVAELAAQNNVTLDSLDALYRRFTIERKISEAVEKEFPGADEQRLNEEFAKRLVATASAMKIRINPRYGTFDPTVGQIQTTRFDFLQPPAK